MKGFIMSLDDHSKYIGQKVEVYYNLHKNTFSIRSRILVDGEWRQRVIVHADYVQLDKVSFQVNQLSRYKVRLEKSKNVHAYVKGILKGFIEYQGKGVSSIVLPKPKTMFEVSYNPYDDKHDRFYLKNTTTLPNKDQIELVDGNAKMFFDHKTQLHEKINLGDYHGRNLIEHHQNGVDMINYDVISDKGFVSKKPKVYLR